MSIFAIDKALHSSKHFRSNIQIVLDGKPQINSLTKLSPEYHDYVNVSSVAKLDNLSLYKSYNHKIQLEHRKISDHGPIYEKSREKHLSLKK